MGVAENTFEIERRRQLYHKDTTMPTGQPLGYDGDPNLVVPGDSDGEFLLYYAPSGTNFTQKNTTPFTIWSKKSDTPGGLWEIDGSGGGGLTEVPAQHVELLFDFSQTGGTLDIGQAVKNQKVLKTILNVAEPFDKDLGITIGTDTSPAILMTVAENDPSILNEYSRSNNLSADDLDVFRTFFTYTEQPTVGSASVTIYFN